MFETIGINDSVRNTEHLLRRLLAENIEISLVLAGNAGFVRARPGDIEQILTDLAVAAQKAMPEGGTICIETSFTVVDDQFAALCLSVPPGRYAQIIMSATGDGEPPEAQLAREIIARNGGSISVHSAPKLGTTCRILFPAVEFDSVQENDSGAAAGTSGHQTILLVEDEALIRKFVERVLTAEGYRVLEAGSPTEAFELASHHPGPIDLLLTDFVLPDLTGNEIAREVRQLRPNIPVILMSGYSEHLARYTVEGMPFLQKPFKRADLLGLLRATLNQ